MKIDRWTLVVAAACFVAGVYLTGRPAAPGPLTPGQDRPVLRWVAAAAKNALWLFLLAEDNPTPDDETRYAQHAIGDDGFPVIDHGRSL
jgi:hypothetical protein